MKKITIKAKSYGPADIEEIASIVGASVTKDALDSKQCTVFMLTTVDRELLSGARDSLLMAFNEFDEHDKDRRINEALDQINKVLAT